MFNSLIDRGKKDVAGIYQQMYANKWIDECGGGISYRIDRDVLAIPNGFALKFKVKAGNVDVKPFDTFQEDTCAGLIRMPFTKFGANAIVHTHSVNAIVVADWCGDHDTISWSGFNSIASIYNRELGTYYDRSDTVILPIINNVDDLEGRMIEVCNTFIASSAVLVRRHGLFIWDRLLEGAFKQCEAYEKLFKMDVKNGQAHFNNNHPRQ